MLTATFLRSFESQLGNHFHKKIHIRRITPLAGGSINLAAKADTTAGLFFVKVNDASAYPNMFEKEAHGLMILKQTETISIPEVIYVGEAEEQSFIVLQFIESRNRISNFSEKFGASIAKLHKNSDRHFGFEEDNYIGSLVQSNRKHTNWFDFFVEERLEKQFKLALKSGQLLTTDRQMLDKLIVRSEELIPKEEPALLHGDLWNGNYLADVNGDPCLIDPAVYFGHREMDLSMSRLFGGFDNTFYESYCAQFPLADGFEERIDIHNLYPLMVHVNLFGGGYVQQVRSILKRFK